MGFNDISRLNDRDWTTVYGFKEISLILNDGIWVLMRLHVWMIEIERQCMGVKQSSYILNDSVWVLMRFCVWMIDIEQPCMVLMRFHRFWVTVYGFM